MWVYDITRTSGLILLTVVTAGCFPTANAQLTRCQSEKKQLLTIVSDEKKRAATLAVENKELAAKLAEAETQFAKLHDASGGRLAEFRRPATANGASNGTTSNGSVSRDRREASRGETDLSPPAAAKPSLNWTPKSRRTASTPSASAQP